MCLSVCAHRNAESRNNRRSVVIKRFFVYWISRASFCQRVIVQLRTWTLTKPLFSIISYPLLADKQKFAHQHTLSMRRWYCKTWAAHANCASHFYLYQAKRKAQCTGALRRILCLVGPGFLFIFRRNFPSPLSVYHSDTFHLCTSCSFHFITCPFRFVGS